MPGLAGRLAVVTGGSRGIGRGIALRLAAEGADCALTYRQNAEQAQAVVKELEALGRRALAVPLELTDPAAVPVAFDRIAERFATIDILVASAAATAFRPLLDQKPHNVRRTLAISLESFLAAVQASARRMPGPGRIVIVSGIDSFQAMEGHGLLGAAKAGMESLVRALALELGPRGITVNGVNPGFVETDSSRYYIEQGLGRDLREALAELVAATPVRRLGTVEDVAGFVAYLASDAASFLTGQTVVLDGGLTIVSPLQRLVRQEGAPHAQGS